MRSREWQNGSVYVRYEHVYSSSYRPIWEHHDPDPVPLAGYLRD